MVLDLTDEETDALARRLRRAIDADRYPLSPRIQTLKAVLDKIRPEPARQPLPPPLSPGRDLRPRRPIWCLMRGALVSIPSSKIGIFEESRFALDSSLEGRGFEPSVPPANNGLSKPLRLV
jgi:hypothetical protein